MKNRWASYINGFAVTALLLGILVLVQLIAYRQELRWDFTDSGRYSLSRQSRDVLAMLEAPLTAVAFYGEAESGVSSLQELFREYEIVYPSFHYKIVNPAKNPDITQQYQVKSHGTVVLEYGGLQKKVVGVDEERLTNAIYQLIDSRRKTIYFSLGHGEKSKDMEGGLLWQALEEENYRIAPLYMNKTRRIPEDASCLVIAGPKADFFEHEIDQLHAYLKRGGSVALFLDPYQDAGLKTFLRSHGIELSEMSIVDRVAKLPNGGELFPAVSRYSTHPITRYLSQLTFFPVARPIEVLDPVPATHTIEPLVQTEMSGWGESDRQSLIDKSADFDPDKDTPGPVNIGVTVKIYAEDTQETSRLVVFGDSDFLADDYLFMAGNRDLALNTLAWATAREGYITIRSRDGGFTPIILSHTQQRVVVWLSLCLLPGLALIAGIWVQLRWMKK
jgi:ABC-type uncharacterized transport system involved in gliding motility auxiliary subunit